MRYRIVAVGLLISMFLSAGCGMSNPVVPTTYSVALTVCGYDTGTLAVEYLLMTSGLAQTEQVLAEEHQIIDRDTGCWHTELNLFASQSATLTAMHAPNATQDSPLLVCEIRVDGLVAAWDVATRVGEPVECVDAIP